MMSVYARKITLVAFAIGALFLMATSPALAAIFDVLPSSSFDWQYEFDVMPSTQDLDENGVSDFSFVGATGTLNGDGTWSMDSSTGASYLNAGSADQIWSQSGINYATGYTLELRARINTAGEGANTLALNGIDNAAGSWLNLKPESASWGVSWNPDGIVTLDESINSDDFHTYRIAQKAGQSNYFVWKDDVLISSYLDRGFNYSNLSRLLLGDPGGEHQGTADIDYLRFTEGAYAPATSPVVAPPSTIKASSEFAYKYEMDVDPTDLSAIDLDSNGIADWAFAGSGTPSLTGNGTMMFDPDGTTSSYIESGISTADHVWATGDFGVEDGFTVEISVKLDPNNTDKFGFNPCPSDSREFPYFTIYPDSQGWYDDNISIGLEGDTYDNTDAFHVFRLAHNATADGGKWFVWRDGELLTPEGLDAQMVVTRNALYMGDLGAEGEAAAEVEYVRFMSGAFAPEEVTPDIAGDANKDGKVDGSDVTILAGNWQKGVDDGLTASWEEGDFNGDGKVDGSDVTILAGNWQYGVEAAAASVPEPSTLVLLLAAMASLVMVRRQK